MLEVCVDTVRGAEVACAAGADRIELSSVLEVGGVTPSNALLQATRRVVQVPLVVLIRCRAGSFVYRPDEYDLMLEEAKQALAMGADGVVVGGLRDQALHSAFLEQVAELRKGPGQAKKELVVHRAFDAVREPAADIEVLCRLGFDRILTSGGPLHAEQGIAELRQLVAMAKGRIQILPAGGIGPNNAIRILQETGCDQLHGSFRSTVATTAEETGYRICDPLSVSQTREAMMTWRSARN